MIVLVFHMETLSHAAAGGEAAVDPPPPCPALLVSIFAYPVQLARCPLSPGHCSGLQGLLITQKASWKATGFIDRSCREP